jgi:hypothetical protein
VRYLTIEPSEGADGVTTLEAMASTSAAHHAGVMAEARRVLDWAWTHFPGSQGPADDGMDWDHDLQVRVEAGGWHTVTLALTASARFAEEFLAVFGEPGD